MNKRKLRAFAWAMVTVLAFIPFLSGCASGNGGTPEDVADELTYDEQQRNDAEGSIGEGEEVQYGQVVAVDGDQVTVVVGEVVEAGDGSGAQAFSSGQDEIAFNASEVQIVDESGAAVESRTLSAEDVIVMRGMGSGADFRPTMVEVIEVAGAGTSADDAMVPQDIE